MRRYIGSRYTSGVPIGEGVIQHPFIDGHDIIGVFGILATWHLGLKVEQLFEFGSMSLGVGFADLKGKD